MTNKQAKNKTKQKTCLCLSESLTWRDDLRAALFTLPEDYCVLSNPRSCVSTNYFECSFMNVRLSNAQSERAKQ